MTQSALLETELAPYFTVKAPFQFPVNFREGFVKYWPIITLIVMVLTIPAILVFLGLGAALMPASFIGGVGTGLSYTLTMILSILGLVLGVLALPGLFNRKRAGWVFSYYAEILSIVASLIGFNFFSVLFGLVFLMLLFQVRDYYR